MHDDLSGLWYKRVIFSKGTRLVWPNFSGVKAVNSHTHDPRSHPTWCHLFATNRHSLSTRRHLEKVTGQRVKTFVSLAVVGRSEAYHLPVVQWGCDIVRHIMRISSNPYRHRVWVVEHPHSHNRFKMVIKTYLIIIDNDLQTGSKT